MKKIKLKNYTLPDKESPYSQNKLYKISLGNGFQKSFENEKEIKAFIAETNRVLNDRMYELNFMFSEVFRIYRTSWLYFDFNSCVKQNLQGIIQDKVNSLEMVFNLMVDRSGWENGNYNVFNHFYSVIRLQKEILEDMLELYISKSHTAQIYEIRNIISRLTFIYTAITVYPQKMQIISEQNDNGHTAVLRVVS